MSVKMLSLTGFNLSPIPPLSLLPALFIAYSLSALIISITASACVRSIRPERKALFVNSPGSASLAPAFIAVSSTFFVINAPPWQFISTTSSLV